jgi:hypothetical protein
MSLLLGYPTGGPVSCRDTSRLAAEPVTGLHRITVIHQPACREAATPALTGST